MIAPCCDICGSWELGSYIQFKVIKEEEIAYNKMYESKEIDYIPTGHPYGNRPFCKDHFPIAIKYAHLPYREEAYLLIKQEIALTEE